MYPRARRRSSASTSGVSCSSAPSSPSPHARSSSVTAPGDGVIQDLSMGAVSHTLHARLGTEPGRFWSIFEDVHPQTGVPAFQREGGLPAVRWRNAMTRTSRNVTVGLIVTSGWQVLDGCGQLVARPKPRTGQIRLGGAGLESDLHRHAHCDEYGELLQSAARGDRSYGDLRCVQRHRTALHADLRSRQGPRRRIAPSGGRRCGVHGAGRPVPVPDSRRWMPAMRLRSRR